MKVTNQSFLILALSYCFIPRCYSTGLLIAERSGANCGDYKRRCENEYICKLRLKTAQLRCNYPELDGRGEIIRHDLCTSTCFNELNKFLKTRHSGELLFHSIVGKEMCVEVSPRLETCFKRHIELDQRVYGKHQNHKKVNKHLNFCKHTFRPAFEDCAQALLEKDDLKFCSEKCDAVIDTLQYYSSSPLAKRFALDHCLYNGSYKESLKRSFRNRESPQVHHEELEERHRTRCSNPSRNRGDEYGFRKSQALLTNKPFAKSKNEGEQYHLSRKVDQKLSPLKMSSGGLKNTNHFFPLVVLSLITLFNR